MTFSSAMLRGVSVVVASLLSASLTNADELPPLVAADWNAGDTQARAVEDVSASGGASTFASAVMQPALETSSVSLGSRTTIQRLFAPPRLTSRRSRLSRVPEILGGHLLPASQLTAIEAVNNANGLLVSTPIANAGGSARVQVAVHNKAAPADRFYVNYNHVHNALTRQAVLSSPNIPLIDRQRDGNVDRFVLGLERTLLEGDASIELRLPLGVVDDSGIVNLAGNSSADLRSDSGVVGNTSIIGKHVAMEADNWVTSIGLAVDLPTGSDASVIVNESIYTIANEAYFLHPFLAMSAANETTFLHTFLQIDIPLNDDGVSVDDLTGRAAPGGAGSIRQQALLHWNISAGRWLIRDAAGSGRPRLAALLEYHLTQSLNGVDTVSGFRRLPYGDSVFMLQSSRGNFTSSYLTAGLHAEFAGDCTLRAAAVAPLGSRRDRFSDAEVVVQVGRRY
jgi:hypothetical protein